MKILFLSNVPVPYRVDFFNELGKKCDLMVLFERNSSAIRDKSWNYFEANHFKAILLNGLKFRVANALCPSVIKYLKKNKYDHIVVTNYSGPTGLLAILYMKLKKIPYEIESDGGFAKNGVGFKEKIKKWAISGADCCFSTADVHDEYYMKYGVKKEKIYRYPFSSIRNMDILTKTLSNEEKASYKKQIGITEKRMVLAIGQFTYRKGFDLLIQASDKIQTDVGIYIVGGEPSENYINLKKAHNSETIHFENFKSKEELAVFFKAADIFVLPTREDIWGLVINEAMAYGLPVITTDKCIAGLELVDSQNGEIIKIDSVDEIADSINRIISNTELLTTMSQQSIVKIRQHTIETMVDAHLNKWNTKILLD